MEVANEPAEEFYGEDNMLEMYDPEKGENIDFDLFDTDHDRAMRFKNSLVCFSDVENHFFLYSYLRNNALTQRNIVSTFRPLVSERNR